MSVVSGSFSGSINLPIRRHMYRFLFDYVYDEQQKIVMNELLASSIEAAIEFIDEHFLELHAERETEISAIRLRTERDEEILHYPLHRDVITR